MSKKAALLLWFCLGLTPISAAQLLVSGEVSPINEIIIEDMGISAGIVGEALVQHRKIPMIKFKLNNNDPDGFYVHFSSFHQGRLVSQEDATDTIPYTISTEPDRHGSSTLAGTAEPLPLQDLSLAQDAHLIFDTQVVHATRHRAYTLYVAASETVAHPNTYYGDNLTITIHNL